ncbi:ACP S-malonyltransferase [Mucisphaera calidilacus]|uniref:Malonyl CoA-acyl carrier protein transacylase n=1 Tax=Mucisphaera calidilacus TaxID=2527982 RepID=A0A518BVW3_9BACT|nr:ACP S-malonyltransferase [Mucisphaera calidilacus]QDU71101.1 Malonyl CoA-acyl carrier protein transacylase [Mucisphaera calidilacus]
MSSNAATQTVTAVALLCPGQGAQHIGMGKSWAEASAAARDVFQQANDILGYDLTSLCFDGPEDVLNRTDRAQPAIYTASVASYRGLVETGELNPDDLAMTAGLSLGEFTALHLADAVTFENGLKLVQLRGEAMQQAAEAADSSMVAVTGDVTEEKILELCDKARGEGILVPANYNSPMQVVVSGSTDACERAVKVADEMGLKPTPLAVAGAFHSPIMAPAANKLREALVQTPFTAPRVPVIANVTGQPHDDNPDAIREQLVNQLTHPVRWTQSMGLAAQDFSFSQFRELAPGRVLSGLMRRIDRSIKVRNHAEPA